jgi:hypothetical protein
MVVRLGKYWITWLFIIRNGGSLGEVNMVLRALFKSMQIRQRNSRRPKAFFRELEDGVNGTATIMCILQESDPVLPDQGRNGKALAVLGMIALVDLYF